jgi:hypothetical protein
MRKCENISPYMRRPLVIYIYMTLQLLHSEFPYIWGKFDFLFYQCINISRITRKFSFYCTHYKRNLHIAHCTLHTARCTLHSAHCTLHAAHCILHTEHCKLHSSHCTLHTAHSTLHRLRTVQKYSMSAFFSISSLRTQLITPWQW